MSLETKKLKGKLESLKESMTSRYARLVDFMIDIKNDSLIYIWECCGYVTSLSSRIYSFIVEILTKTRRAVSSWVTRKKTTK